MKRIKPRPHTDNYELAINYIYTALTALENEIDSTIEDLVDIINEDGYTGNEDQLIYKILNEALDSLADRMHYKLDGIRNNQFKKTVSRIDQLLSRR